MNYTTEPVIGPMQPSQVPAVAELHAAGISSGFISSLGKGFIGQLYRGITSSAAGFCLVAVESDKVLGFIAGTESVGKLYKSIILRRGLLMMGCLLRFAFNPRTIRRIFQTLLYPSRTAKTYPAAEVLSVVVAKESRGKGIGSKLMEAALEEFRRRGISEIKVAVAADNESANKYYLKEGFEKAGDYDSHGVATDIYVRKIQD